MKSLSDLPLPAVVAISAAVILQLGLQIVALVSLARRPAALVSLSGRKWLWALIIVVGELAGPIAYFVAGRLPAVADESAPAVAGADRGARVIDVLYGQREPAAGEREATRR